MATTRLSSKGQLIIPKEVRDRHGWRAGTELEVEDQGGVVVLRCKKPWPPSRIEDVSSCQGEVRPKARSRRSMSKRAASMTGIGRIAGAQAVTASAQQCKAVPGGNQAFARQCQVVAFPGRTPRVVLGFRNEPFQYREVTVGR